MCIDLKYTLKVRHTLTVIWTTIYIHIYLSVSLFMYMYVKGMLNDAVAYQSLCVCLCVVTGKRIPVVDAAGGTSGKSFKLGRQASESRRTCCWWYRWLSPTRPVTWPLPAVLWAYISSKPPHTLKILCSQQCPGAAVLQQMVIFFLMTFTNSTSSCITLNLQTEETLQVYQASTKCFHLYMHKCCPGLLNNLQFRLGVRYSYWFMDSFTPVLLYKSAIFWWGGKKIQWSELTLVIFVLRYCFFFF